VRRLLPSHAFRSFVGELAAGEDQFEIGVAAELLPMPSAIESFEPDTHF
jgi:hypothetical protein